MTDAPWSAAGDARSRGGVSGFDYVMPLLMGKPPTDGMPISTLMVALQELHEGAGPPWFSRAQVPPGSSRLPTPFYPYPPAAAASPPPWPKEAFPLSPPLHPPLPLTPDFHPSLPCLPGHPPNPPLLLTPPNPIPSPILTPCPPDYSPWPLIHHPHRSFFPMLHPLLSRLFLPQLLISGKYNTAINQTSK